jgi:succinate dehydrogenase / fumarate reductase iron-sulfur subunit
MAREMVKFKIFRFDPERDASPRFDSFNVPLRPAMTVLDALYYIQQWLDGSIAFRSSCRAGVCGSCAMHINGVYRLACQTQVAICGSVIKIRPLAHLEVLKDLVVDMKLFWDKYNWIKPYLIPGDPNPGKERIQSIDQRESLTGIIDCILCGSCYSSCPVTLTDPEYLGPAALMKAARFLKDSRDKATEERLRLVDGQHGIWRCHTVFNCQKACPKELDPSAAIRDLKMGFIARRFIGAEVK